MKSFFLRVSFAVLVATFASFDSATWAASSSDSRFAILGEFTPGVGLGLYQKENRYDLLSSLLFGTERKVSYEILLSRILGGNVGARFYILDHCHGLAGASCLQLSTHLRVGARLSLIDTPSVTSSLGIELSTFFGSQRRVAWLVQAGVLFLWHFGGQKYSLGPTYVNTNGGPFVQPLLGMGIAVHVFKDLRLTLRVESGPNQSSLADFLFPIGIEYRF